MRTFIVTCPECDCDLDVEIEDADLLDTDLGHIVTCADCQTETEYVYDTELDDLVPVDEFEEDDPETDPMLTGDESDESDEDE